MFNKGTFMIGVSDWNLVCVCPAAFADAEGKNLASLLLRCVQLTDGVSQIHCVKQVRARWSSGMCLQNFYVVLDLKFD